MKKIICAILVFTSALTFAARNEDEDGPERVQQNGNESRNEINALRGRNTRANRRSQYPPDESDIEREINRRRSGPQRENPDDVGRRGERRSFASILNNFNSRNRRGLTPRLPWTNNGHNIPRKQNKLKLALSLSHSDIMIIKHREGFELFIRKKKNINSVILTNVSGDFRAHNSNISEYTLRSKNYIKTNSSYLLKYKGKLIGKKEKLYFLASSSPVKHKVFKMAFKIFVPNYVIYGYKWENFATMLISEGTAINIRTFKLKNGDYKKGFSDNVVTVDTVLYSGKDMFAPIMKLYYIADSADYITAYVAYYDNNKYFKGFYIAEDANPEIELFFSENNTPKDLRGILLISEYDLISKKTVKFKIFIEKKDRPRKIIIYGEDTSGNRPLKPVILNVPKKSTAAAASPPPVTSSRPQQGEQGSTPPTQASQERQTDETRRPPQQQ